MIEIAAFLRSRPVMMSGELLPGYREPRQRRDALPEINGDALKRTSASNFLCYNGISEIHFRARLLREGRRSFGIHDDYSATRAKAYILKRDYSGIDNHAERLLRRESFLCRSVLSFPGGKIMTHEFDGKKYEKASAHQKEWGSRLISGLELKGNESVLDLGCGDGVLTSRIAELLAEGEILGIDSSQGMIDAALPKERSNVHFRKLDINHLDFEGGFDLVFSNAALHWVKDHHVLLRNVHRALRPGGRIRFNFAGDGNCSNFFFVVRQAMEREEFSSFFIDFEWPWYMPDVDEYSLLVESSRFRGVRVWGENADHLFPDAEAMIRWIEQPCLVPFLASIPDSAKDSFRNFIVNNMIDRTRQEDGRCFETFRRINVSAEK